MHKVSECLRKSQLLMVSCKVVFNVGFIKLNVL